MSNRKTGFALQREPRDNLKGKLVDNGTQITQPQAESATKGQRYLT